MWLGRHHGGRFSSKPRHGAANLGRRRRHRGHCGRGGGARGVAVRNGRGRARAVVDLLLDGSIGAGASEFVQLSKPIHALAFGSSSSSSSSRITSQIGSLWRNSIVAGWLAVAGSHSWFRVESIFLLGPQMDLNPVRWLFLLFFGGWQNGVHGWRHGVFAAARFCFLFSGRSNASRTVGRFLGGRRPHDALLLLIHGSTQIGRAHV